MTDLNVIDQFLQAFIRYIDSGFGLLGVVGGQRGVQLGELLGPFIGEIVLLGRVHAHIE